MLQLQGGHRSGLSSYRSSETMIIPRSTFFFYVMTRHTLAPSFATQEGKTVPLPMQLISKTERVGGGARLPGWRRHVVNKRCRTQQNIATNPAKIVYIAGVCCWSDVGRVDVLGV
jgi:hypothetical protein